MEEIVVDTDLMSIGVPNPDPQAVTHITYIL
jgi:hypothetical protein